jgi:hypothetical protein
MTFDEKNVDETIDRNETSIAGEREPASSEFEKLNDLVEAIRTERYVDWLTFAQKRRI